MACDGSEASDVEVIATAILLEANDSEIGCDAVAWVIYNKLKDCQFKISPKCICLKHGEFETLSPYWYSQTLLEDCPELEKARKSDCFNYAIKLAENIQKGIKPTENDPTDGCLFLQSDSEYARDKWPAGRKIGENWFLRDGSLTEFLTLLLQ